MGDSVTKKEAADAQAKKKTAKEDAEKALNKLNSEKDAAQKKAAEEKKKYDAAVKEETTLKAAKEKAAKVMGTEKAALDKAATAATKATEKAKSGAVGAKNGTEAAKATSNSDDEDSALVWIIIGLVFLVLGIGVFIVLYLKKMSKKLAVQGNETKIANESEKGNENNPTTIEIKTNTTKVLS